jgi:hypothetical protein
MIWQLSRFSEGSASLEPGQLLPGILNLGQARVGLTPNFEKLPEEPGGTILLPPGKVDLS